MFTVLVANIKGGCGKTTVATHLAAAFAAAGHAAYLADTDRQRSSLGWAARRPPDRPPVRALDWTRAVGAPPPGGGRLVIDAPAALKGDRIEALVGTADMVVVPVLPGVFDEQATRRFLERLEPLKAVAKGRTPVVVIGNRVRAGARSSNRLDEFVAALGHPMAGRLRDSHLYGDAAAGGLSLFDLPGRRTLAIRADWQPVLALVEAAAASASAPQRVITAVSAGPLVWRASDESASSRS